MSGHPPPPRPAFTNLSPESNAREDLTWLDFIRAAGGTVHADRPAPPERQISADRKRRYTGNSQEGRSYPYPHYTVGSLANRRQYHPTGSNASQPGSSRESAVNIGSSPPPQRPVGASHPPGISFYMPPHQPILTSHPPGMPSVPGENGRARYRRGPDRVVQQGNGEIVLPPWQPDSDVTKCPVCEAEFTFLHRRHHCRKCGRVVCAACSPHRITIPRQYIVQPPNPWADQSDNISADGDGDGNPALGGGEVVRVCNPCVPDPWTPNTESAPRPLPNPPVERHRDTTLTGSLPHYRSGNSWTHASGGRPSPTHSHTRHRSQSYFHPPSVRDDDTHPLFGASQNRHHNSNDGGAETDQRIFYNHWNRRHTHSNSGAHVPPVPGLPYQDSHHARPTLHHRRAPSIPANVAPLPPPPPRRVVDERDECPVCGVELPPGDNIREAHVRDCIETRFSTSTNVNTISPLARGELDLTAATATATPQVPPPESVGPGAGSGPAVPTSSRPRATSYRPRGMAISNATEKDCIDEEGEAVECVICFEEFKPGDKLGRMECLCKFHRTCIRDWWERKGQGSCPTHQLHE